MICSDSENIIFILESKYNLQLAHCYTLKVQASVNSKRCRSSNLQIGFFDKIAIPVNSFLLRGAGDGELKSWRDLQSCYIRITLELMSDYTKLLFLQRSNRNLQNCYFCKDQTETFSFIRLLPNLKNNNWNNNKDRRLT